jgi:hypothetical protein
MPHNNDLLMIELFGPDDFVTAPAEIPPPFPETMAYEPIGKAADELARNLLSDEFVCNVLGELPEPSDPQTTYEPSAKAVARHRLRLASLFTDIEKRLQPPKEPWSKLIDSMAGWCAKNLVSA